jgi:hypothetical protein
MCMSTMYVYILIIVMQCIIYSKHNNRAIVTEMANSNVGYGWQRMAEMIGMTVWSYVAF